MRIRALMGGMSFVIFPVDGGPCRPRKPGIARKLQAVCSWLNQRFGAGELIAWAKQDQTRVDIALPASVQKAFEVYKPALKRYGRVLWVNPMDAQYKRHWEEPQH
jgi:hypothetical protein